MIFDLVKLLFFGRRTDFHKDAVIVQKRLDLDHLCIGQIGAELVDIIDFEFSRPMLVV